MYSQTLSEWLREELGYFASFVHPASKFQLSLISLITIKIYQICVDIQ